LLTTLQHLRELLALVVRQVLHGGDCRALQHLGRNFSPHLPQIRYGLIRLEALVWPSGRVALDEILRLRVLDASQPLPAPSATTTSTAPSLGLSLGYGRRSGRLLLCLTAAKKAFEFVSHCSPPWLVASHCRAPRQRRTICALYQHSAIFASQLIPHAA
jgi:hypothetical protein